MYSQIQEKQKQTTADKAEEFENIEYDCREKMRRDREKEERTFAKEGELRKKEGEVNNLTVRFKERIDLARETGSVAKKLDYSLTSFTV